MNYDPHDQETEEVYALTPTGRKARQIMNHWSIKALVLFGPMMATVLAIVWGASRVDHMVNVEFPRQMADMAKKIDLNRTDFSQADQRTVSRIRDCEMSIQDLRITTATTSTSLIAISERLGDIKSTLDYLSRKSSKP